ncbi:MAG: hypothetical protein O3A00_04455 [Planctomycetota bacterium]|nr:hypothetical protein [Planctomycetota bacterium]
MDIILRGYQVSDATWFYHSLLLIIAVFFRFNRLWSLRNVDLLLLLSLSPGLLLLNNGESTLGKGWLLTVTALLLVRLVTDGLFVRRPKIEQNLVAHGTAFLCIAAFGFLFEKAVNQSPSAESVGSVERARDIMHRRDSSETRANEGGPTADIAAALTLPLADGVALNDEDLRHQIGSTELLAAHGLAVLAHLAVVFGLLFVGKWHFGDIKIGLGMATIYLLLPCTAYDVHKVHHVLPAALIIWAFVAYRRPMLSGALIGLACGTLFFAIFLLPVWMTFYGKRGALRFAAALLIVGAVLLGSLVLTSADSHSLTQQLIGYINWEWLEFRDVYESGVTNALDNTTVGGLWSETNKAYRITVFATFLVMTAALTIWPLQKNVEHLMAASTAIVVGAQVWYPHHGGVFVLWYLPLFLVVMFRPRLTHLMPPVIAQAVEEEQQKPDRRGVQTPSGAIKHLLR